MMKHRYAFTLIEMLVVVAIIAVLAGMLIPTVGMVKKMMSNIKCGNQLQQIGGAIEVYKGENNDLFPEKLFDTSPNSTSDLFHSGGPLLGVTKILLCPFDGTRGADPRMGRHIDWEWNAAEKANLALRKELNSSYLYEVSREPLTAGSGGTIEFFFKDLPRADWPTVGTSESTWAAGKFHQLKFGNKRSDGSYGDPFPPVYFPIVRCFHHYKWRNISSTEVQIKKVKNVSWNLNVFETSPYWEHDINPAILP